MPYKLIDLIDINKLQELLDSLDKSFTIVTAILDNEGNILTASGWQDICTKFHRVHPVCAEECKQSDLHILNHMNEAKPSFTYKCLRGLVDSATPIIIDGKHLGNVFIGQFFLEKPNFEFFRIQAQKYGFDEAAYLEALSKVPIITSDQLEQRLLLIRGFTEYIGNMGLQRLRQIENEQRLSEAQRIAHLGSWEYDIEKNYLIWSDETYRIFGFQPQEFIPTYESFFDNVYFDDREYIKEAFHESVRRGIPQDEIEHRIVRVSDGNIRYVVEKWKPFKDENGTVIRTLGTVNDITERKLAEDALRLDESRFETMFKLSQMKNTSVRELTDFALEEVVRLTESKIGYVAFVSDDETQLVIQAWSRQAMQECNIYIKPIVYPLETTGLWGEALRQRVPIITNDYASPNIYKKGIPEGHVNIISHMSIPVFDGDHIVIVAGVANKETDYKESDVRQLTLLMDSVWKIIQRNKTEQILQDSERRLSEAQHIAHLGSWEYDLETNDLIWSDETYRIFGMQAQEFTPSYESFIDIVHPDDRAKVNEVYVESVRQGIPYEIEHRIIRRSDGNIRYVFEKCRHIKDEADNIIKSSGIVYDITDLKHAEEELKKSEDKFSKAFLSSPVVMSISTLREGRFLEVNEAFTRTMGYSAEEVIGRTSAELNIWVNSSDRNVIIDKLQIGELVRDFEVQLRIKSGDIHTMLFSSETIELGSEKCLLITILDITERIRAEEERKKFEDRLEKQKQMFYRDSILSVTDGKLEICDSPDIRFYISMERLKVNINEMRDVPIARHEVKDFCELNGLVGSRLDSFMDGVGEAIANAIKHGINGTVYGGFTKEAVWVAVSDHGLGIESLILPQAILSRGFSTKPSMGLGYTIILDVADHVMLNTGPNGTTVLITKNFVEPVFEINLKNIPDTWS